MYQRVGQAAYKSDLKNTLKIADVLSQPQRKFKSIHIAGTNGKGSSSHMIASVLQEAGYKTGLYTSPHLTDFRERIKINGKLIPKNYIVEFVEKYKSAFEIIEPSFFEWTVGLAFDYFAKEEVDIAVIEVGLGGRLDSTNVINPLVSLITNISFDHTQLLGDTLQKIAIEKAGIIKHKTPVVISQTQVETMSLFATVARENKSEIEFADKNFKILFSKIDSVSQQVNVLDKANNNELQLKLDLLGQYQQKNVLGVLEVLNQMVKLGFIIDVEHILKGLNKVCKNTGFSGRWQIINEKPKIIVDTAHNEDGIRHLLKNIELTEYKNLHIVFGVVNDKTIDKILTLLPKNAQYYFVKANIPRALDEHELKVQAKKLKLNGESFTNVETGISAAKKKYKPGDLILICGSTFVVADALNLFA
ncbi:MAG: bifunctional folylpolyglutamate synthase/dihydrofolate synthase [Bacteroidetes bacterium]|nr:bifunctional folylpolyglutamate synthase/dihydrofolate synthase [Bacteroidota bacterium]